MSPQRDEEHMIWTIPNALSIGRVVLFIWFLQELFFGGDRFLAAVALSIAGITDYLDGFIARKFHQNSKLGKFLDPAVDRLMTTGTLVSLMVFGVLPLWLGSLVLAREVAVSGAALFVASKGIRDIEVMFVGKLGTFGFMCALPMILFGSGQGTLEHALGATGWIILVPSLILAVISAWMYLPRIRSAFDADNGLRA